MTNKPGMAPKKEEGSPPQPPLFEPAVDGNVVDPETDDNGLIVPNYPTHEDLLLAEQALKKETPETYFTKMEFIRAVEDQEKTPEARTVVYTYLVSESGALFVTTQRGVNQVDAWNELMNGIAYAANFGLSVWKPGSSVGTTSSASTPSTPRGPARPQTPSRPARPQSPETPDSGGRSGTNKVKEITIKDGQLVQFVLEGLKFPLSDHRLKWENGDQVVAEMFDEDLGWGVEIFHQNAIFTPDDFGDIYVDWVQEGKYYNAKRVHA